jgi:hypothetical protein
LETRNLVRGKVYGILGAAQPYLLAYAVPALALAALAHPVALLAVGIGLGVTELAMFFLGGAGIWCSVKAKGSWRALLGTLGWGYLGGFLLYCIASPVILIVALAFYAAVSMIDKYLGTSGAAALGSFKGFFSNFFLASCVVMVCAFFGAAWLFIKSAEKRVAMVERTRIWKSWEYDGDRPRRRRRIADPRGLPTHERKKPPLVQPVGDDDDIPVV